MENHRRRIHYTGKYPKYFNEKYKELQPEKYSDTVDKVINKGSTPAGMHIPIMVREILDFFNIKPGMQGYDATLGYGGHSLEMLKRLNHFGKLVATDIDSIELNKTQARLKALGFTDSDFSAVLSNFSQIDQIAAKFGKFDFVLADLGVSSMQIDNPERGFSYKNQGLLDLRMDSQNGITAAEFLKETSAYELQEILIRNSDEPLAKEIASAVSGIIRKGKEITYTTDLCKIIDNVLQKKHKNLPQNEYIILKKKTYSRVFQALRIEVNHEYDSLALFLTKLPEVLKQGGKVAVLSFHSGEDRLVKQAFKEYKAQGIFSEISENVICPLYDECNRNRRAHSTKMRWAIK